jgi:arylsulfatase
MEADRTEIHDLAADKPELVEKLEAKWDAYAERAMVLPLGAWRGKPKPEKFSKKKRFELSAGDDLARAKAPYVVDKGMTITVSVRKPARDGVLVAQGGSSQGFSLYVQKGKLHFATRNDGHLALVTSDADVPYEPATVTATLDKSGKVALSVDGKQVAEGNVLRPLAEMPQDGLQVGQDIKGAVGRYEAPFPFQGEIGDVTIVLEP